MHSRTPLQGGRRLRWAPAELADRRRRERDAEEGGHTVGLQAGTMHTIRFATNQ